jgi:hypothetical protein
LKESDSFIPGKEMPPVVKTPVGNVGLSIVSLNEEVFFFYPMDLFPNEQNFDLDKSGQTFHHSLKEHHRISNIPQFRCEMW